MRPPRFPLAVILLILIWVPFFSACRGDAMRAAWVSSSPTPTTTSSPTLIPTPTATSTSTPTPVPPLFLPAVDAPTPYPTLASRTRTAGTCTHRIRFLRDVTTPDGASVHAGSAFVKTWRLQNTGTCTWTPNYQLVFVGDQRMAGPTMQPLGQTVPPGARVDVSVKLTAPTQPGAYTGKWMLASPEGMRFGLGEDAQTPFWVTINVP